MALVRWDPVGSCGDGNRSIEPDVLRALQRVFRPAWVPAVDIYETEGHEVVIKAELPDMKREDIGVTFENNVLTLKGERRLEQEAARAVPAHRAPAWRFSRSFTLPARSTPRHISASYKDGVLTIRLPRREEAKPKQISVNVE